MRQKRRAEHHSSCRTPFVVQNEGAVDLPGCGFADQPGVRVRGSARVGGGGISLGRFGGIRRGALVANIGAVDGACALLLIEHNAVTLDFA